MELTLRLLFLASLFFNVSLYLRLKRSRKAYDKMLSNWIREMNREIDKTKT